MRVRLGLLRAYLREAALMDKSTTPAAPTDPDAAVPGHLPNELPDSAAMEETDDRMQGDGKGNGIPDPVTGVGEDDIASHLSGDDEKTSLGSPPEEKPTRSFYDEAFHPGWLDDEIRSYMLQEHVLSESPPGAGAVDPREPKGFYSEYDPARDHGDVDKMHGFWSGSPARPAGTEGDPFRGEDPYAQLGFHSPKGPHDGTTPPAASGEEGVDARRAPEEWTLNAGSDTSKVLGANAKPDTGDEESDDEPEEGEEGEAGEVGETGEDGDELDDTDPGKAQSKKQG